MRIYFILFIILSAITFKLQAQAPGCPNVNAGNDQTINCNSCANLTAVPLATGATTSYTVSSVPYSPPFAFNAGTAIMVGTDDIWSSVINLPFNFCFFGTMYNKIVVGANGLITFDQTDAGAYCPWSYSATLPSSSLPTNAIFGPYHDIDPSVSGKIYQSVQGTYPCRTFVVNYDGVAMYSCTSLKATHQIVLYEGTNVIEVYVKSAPGCSSWNSGNKVIGIQNAAGTQAYFPTSPNRNTAAWTATNEAWRFTPSGAPNYALTWLQGTTQISTNATVQVCPLTTTTYTAKVVYTNCDGTSYTATDNVTVNINNNINISVSPATSSICPGQSVTLNASGNATSYLWSTGATGSSLTVSPATTSSYTVTGTAGTCSNIATATINVNPIPNADAGASQTICSGSSATLTATGGGTYAWSNGSNIASISVSPTTTTQYYVTISNAGCTKVDSVTVSVIQSVSAGQSKNVCGLSDTLAASALQPGYTGQWSCATPGVIFSNPASPNSIVTVPQTNSYAFTWTVSDGSGSTCSAQVIMKFQQKPTSTFTITPVNCYGEQANINFTGFAETGATFHWTISGSSAAGNQQTWDTLWNTAGTYPITLQVSATSFCSSTVTSNSVIYPPQLVTTVTTTDVQCFGTSTGQVTTTVSGGTPGYTYSWSNGVNPPTSTSPTIAGTYALTVTDSKGCQNIKTPIVISQPNPLVSTPQSTNLDCYNVPTGSASISMSGGTGPGTYIYSWTGPSGFTATTSSINNRPAGTYNVTITDGNQCEVNNTFTLTEPPQLTATASIIQQITCFGLCNGSASITAGGGTPPYTYSWGSSQNNALCPGTATNTVTDNKNCTASASVTITQPQQLNATISAHQDINCFGYNNGSATVTATGGTPAYTYLWSGGGSQASTSNLGPNTYIVTVTDTKTCSDTAIVTITQPTQLVAVLSNSANVTCFNLCNGNANISTNGGTTPYQYSWDFGAFGNNSSNNSLCANNHTVYIKDANQCRDTVTFVITQPTELNVLISTYTNVTCYNANDGTATSIASGGTPNYTYSWSGGGNSDADINTGMSSGLYYVTVTDNNNCRDSAFVTITQPLLLSGNATVSTNFNGYSVSCNGFSDGCENLTISGGTSPYNFIWSNGMSLEDNCNLGAGTYTATVLDVNSCSTIVSVTLNEPPVLLSNVNAVSNYNGYQIACFGGANGTVDLNVTGGVMPYSYLWSNSATTQDLSNVTEGNYSVVVTDANGCVAFADTILTEPLQVETNIIPSNVLCFGVNSGSADLSVTGGVPGYTYQWSNNATSQDLNNILAGTYFVTVKDLNNCVIKDTALITQPPKLYIDHITDTIICNGALTHLSVNVFGGTGFGTYSYEWSTSEITSAINVSPTNNTTYSLTVSDANLCTDTANIIVNVRPPLTLTLYTETDSVCEGSPAFINAIIQGGIGQPYTLLGPQNNMISTPYEIYPGTTASYIFTARDDCYTTAKDTIKITVVPKPVVSFSANKYAGCQPLTVNFHELVNEPGSEYHWNFYDDNSYSSSHYPAHTFSAEGSYDVSLTIISKFGCENTALRTEMITVYPKPDARFNYYPEIASILDPNISFTNYSSDNVVRSLWNFGDKDTSDAMNPMHAYHKVGNYNVTMIAETQYGCKDTSKAKIIIRDEYTFFAPSAFSPAGAIEANQKFNVVGNGIDPKKFLLVIYDRWGEWIFDTLDMEKGWDGKLKGEICEAGTYIWVCTYTDKSRVVHQKSGTVTLIR